MFPRLVYTAGMAVVTTPYNLAFVEDLKTSIPAHARMWDKETKTWRVDLVYASMAEQILRHHFPFAEIEERETFRMSSSYQPHSSCGCTADHKLLGVCVGADPDLVKAALRVAAKKSHPDLGGSNAEMQAINAAADRLLQEVR